MVDDFDPRRHPDPEAICSWGLTNPTAVIDAAGMNLTQELVNFILKRLRDGQGRFEPQLIDVRIRNLQINQLPESVAVHWPAGDSGMGAI